MPDEIYETRPAHGETLFEMVGTREFGPSTPWFRKAHPIEYSLISVGGHRVVHTLGDDLRTRVQIEFPITGRFEIDRHFIH